MLHFENPDTMINFKRYVVGLCPVPGTELLKSLEFPK